MHTAQHCNRNKEEEIEEETEEETEEEIEEEEIEEEVWRREDGVRREATPCKQQNTAKGTIKGRTAMRYTQKDVRAWVDLETRRHDCARHAACTYCAALCCAALRVAPRRACRIAFTHSLIRSLAHSLTRPLTSRTESRGAERSALCYTTRVHAAVRSEKVSTAVR